MAKKLPPHGKRRTHESVSAGGDEMLQAKFITLARLLRDLGFTTRTQPGSFTRFDHAETGTWFLYPDYAPDEDVFASDLVGTRYMLDAKGLLPREELEARLKENLVGG